MNKVSVLFNQSILDVTLQHCGTIENLFEVMKTNNMQELPLIPTQLFYIPSIIRKDVVDYYIKQNKQLASIGSDYYGAFSFGFSNGFN